MYIHVCMVSHFNHVWLFVMLWTVAHQAPLSMGFPGKNTGVGCHALLYRIFLTQESNGCLLCLLHWQVGSLTLAPPGKHVDLYNRRFTVEIDSHEHKVFKKLHCLLTASWKIRTTSGIIQFESEGLRTKTSSIEGQEDLDNLAQKKKKIDWIHLSFPFLFCSGPKFIEWCPQALVKTTLFYSFYWSNTNLFSKHFHRHPEIMLYQLSGHYLPQTSYHLKLIITAAFPLCLHISLSSVCLCVLSPLLIRGPIILD